LKLLVLFGSSRKNGNTEILTDRLTNGIDCTRIYLADKRILPIDDRRHDPAGFPNVDDDYDDIVEQVLSHDVLIFSTPLYWYGMSGPMKNFVDRWSQSLRDKRFDFKSAMRQKRAYVVVVGGDQPRFKGLPLIQQFQYIFDFMQIEFCGFIIGEGNRPGDIMQDQRALSEADVLNQNLKDRLGKTE
jgi:multimeric flavodoxin WrbA